MITDDNNQNTSTDDQSNDVGDQGGETQDEVITLKKADYDKLQTTLGSMKRELKDFRKPKEETVTKTPEVPALLQKSYLRAAGITAQDEVALAMDTAKKWGVEVDQIVDDEDFQVKLGRLRTQKSNEVATTNVRGGSGTSQAKNTSEYWIAKGIPPSPTDVPDRKTRAKIALDMMANAKSGKTFYND